MKAKRIIALLLAGAMMLSLTAGCSTKASSKATPEKTDSTTEAPKDSGETPEKKEEGDEKTDDSNQDSQKENAAGQEDTAGNLPEISDSVLWINTTYVMLTAVNGGDVHYIGGFDKVSRQTIRVQSALKSSWDVTDRATADETIAWLLDEGHRAEFKEEMENMQELGYFDLSPDELKAQLAADGCTEEEVGCYMATVEDYRSFGEQAIDAWDYCRALQLLGWYYVADYYTEQEALDKSLEISGILQSQYNSWDELCESYLRGYNYWAGDDPKAPDSETSARRAVYDALKASPDNPYALDWNVELVKTW